VFATDAHDVELTEAAGLTEGPVSREEQGAGLSQQIERLGVPLGRAKCRDPLALRRDSGFLLTGASLVSAGATAILPRASRLEFSAVASHTDFIGYLSGERLPQPPAMTHRDSKEDKRHPRRDKEII
jgi:hypothetical protein